MDNENIYDAAYSETQVIEENETKHTFNEEPKKEKKKKHRSGPEQADFIQESFCRT